MSNKKGGGGGGGHSALLEVLLYFSGLRLNFSWLTGLVKIIISLFYT